MNSKRGPPNRRRFQFQIRDLMILVALAAFCMFGFKWVWPPPYRAFGAVDCGTGARAAELKARLPELLGEASADPSLKGLPAAPNISQGLKVTIDKRRPELLFVERYTGDSVSDLAATTAVMHAVDTQNVALMHALAQAAKATGKPPTAFLGSATIISLSGERSRLLYTSLGVAVVYVLCVMLIRGFILYQKRKRARTVKS